MTAVSPADRAGSSPDPLADVAPDLAAVLAGTRPAVRAWEPEAISRQTVLVPMRDGIRLATDVYLPPTGRAPAIALRTPYGRATQETTFLALACAGYAVVAQDCRGTGDSEPDHWDFYVHERADSLDFVSWVTGQDWYAGFLGSLGGSYVGGTQWCMAMHPRMSAIAPEVAGLGLVARTGVRFHMFANAYSRTVGKGAGKVEVDLAEMERAMLAETLATGYFNDPLQMPLQKELLERYPHLSPLPAGAARRALWEHYCQAGSDERARIIRLALGLGADGITISDVERLDSVFPHAVHTDAHMLPATSAAGLCAAVRVPALMITGWYDWCLDDALSTWELLAEHGRPEVRADSRLLITPSAHQAPGYHEGRETHPELDRTWRDDPALLLYWHDAVRTGSVADLPVVTYYLMGANQWYTADEWPPAQARRRELYFGPAGTLCWNTPPDWWEPDRYTYDPQDPTPTVGGSILSAVYPPGSADVTELQLRTDVLTFTTEPLAQDLDIVGPLSLVLYASSTAADTDFFARLSDVFPDGRAVQLQNGVVRGRYRDAEGDPSLLEPGTIYCLEINMAATANRFAAGHRLRVDVCSADFPKLERNSNRGGEPGPPVRAVQTIFHGSAYPSHLVVHVI
jgi:predicted acyl esterase